jgi:hypothetical protein
LGGFSQRLRSCSFWVTGSNGTELSTLNDLKRLTTFI